MEYRVENALQRIAALKLCPHCGGTGWEPDSSPPECRVCEGMRVVPALTDCQAQILAQETLALIKMQMSCTCESDEGYCSLHGPSLQQQRIDAFPSIFG